MNLGAHMSIAGGLHRALQRGRSIGCEAVQLFVKSTSGWRARPLSREEIDLFSAEAASFNSDFLIGHASYLVNLASPDETVLARSRRGFVEELERASALGLAAIVLHPGSHRGSGAEDGARRVAEGLEMALEATADGATGILLETTAGQGNTLGSRFEELARIIELAGSSERLGVCFDTCHAFAAGYDLRTPLACRKTFAALEDALPLDRLRAFHLNDSVRGLGERIDRHTHIGKGRLGLPAFAFIVNDPRFQSIPMILETPKGPDLALDVENLAVLKGLRRTRRRKPRRP